MFEMFLIYAMNELYHSLANITQRLKQILVNEIKDFVKKTIAFQIFLWKWSFIASFVFVFGFYLLNQAGIFSVQELLNILGSK